mgnify:CR=1 FL=1
MLFRSAALEDLLDSFAGTLIVISHDRYFIERTCNRFVGLLGDQNLRDLPRSVDEYLERRALLKAKLSTNSESHRISDAAQIRLVKKDMARLEKQIERLTEEKEQLLEEQAGVISDHEKLLSLAGEIGAVTLRLGELESQWLELSERIAQ